jgi:hypothetical protein
MRTRIMLLAAGLLAGCGDKETIAQDSGDSSSGGSDSGEADIETEPVSTYESGQFRVSLLSIESDMTVGVDLDGDGEVDNKLPQVLQLAATLTGEPLDVDSLNTVLLSDISKGALILLTELGYTDRALTVDAMLGVADKSGALSVDKSSYTDGVPNTRFSGAFSSQTDYTSSSERIELPFPLLVGEPAVLVPLELAQNIGSVDGSANGGIIVGAVPVDDFMSQVIDPVIPTGEDYDPSDFLDMDRDELLDFIYEFATGETMADITLADGRKAVSAVVNYSAETSSF